MNDFTKKELKYILTAVRLFGVSMNEYTGVMEPKLQEIHDNLLRMIDNYCEHEPDKGLHTIVSFRSVVSNKVNKCQHCGKYYSEDENS